MVVSVPGHFGSPVVSVPGRFGSWSFQSGVVSNRVISIQSFWFLGFRSRVFSVPGHFGPGSFRSRVVSATGHFGPGSFLSRVIQPWFCLGLGPFGHGSFRSRSFRSRGHFDPTALISVPGRFGPGVSDCVPSVSDHSCICATYLLTYLYMRLVDHFGT